MLFNSDFQVTNEIVIQEKSDYDILLKNDMTKYFLQLKWTLNIYLIPQTKCQASKKAKSRITKEIIQNMMTEKY